LNTQQAAILFVASMEKREHKRKNLVRLGVDPQHAYAWSRTRIRGWAVAQSPIMVTTITLAGLKKRGYKTNARLLPESISLSDMKSCKIISNRESRLSMLNITASNMKMSR
jgi:hypothetical protein